MPGEGQNIIELGFNVEELAAEKKQVLDLFVDLFGKLREYDGTKFNPLGNGGLADLKKSLTDGASAMASFQQSAAKFNETVTDQFKKQQNNKKATDETTLAVNEYKKIVDDTAKTQAKANAQGSNAAENLSIEREQLKQSNAERQRAIKFLLTETGSTGEAKAAVAQLTAARDKENAMTEDGRANIERFNAAIDRNNEFIKANSSNLEKQKINIGNYTGAVVVLKSSLGEIAERLAGMASAGDTASEAYQKLVLEQKILQAQLDRQKEGFSAVTGELRSMRTALDAMAIAGLENTEAFEKLNQVYTTAKQKVNELHEEQKILTAEEPGFTALGAAARGLGGAYAIGAGGAALLADGNEKVEKELNKLVAVMTLLQGLEEAVKAVKDRGAIATALQAAASKALVAAREIELKIFGSTATVLASETAAREVNTVAEEANTVALEANAEGAVLNIEAMEGVVIATEAGTAATIGFRTALISTGIGAIIIAIIYGITKLVGAISDWAEADEKATEKQKALAESSKEIYTLTQQLNEAYEEGAKDRLAAIERQDAAIKASGQNQFTQLAKEREIQLQRMQMAKEQLAFSDLEGNKLEILGLERISALEKVAGFQTRIDALQRINEKDREKDNIEKLQKEQAVAKAELENKEAEFTKGLDAQKAYDDAIGKLDENARTQSLAAFNQLQKVNSDAAERRFATAKDANDRVLNDDDSSFAARLEAVSNNYGAEAQLEKKHEEAVQQQAARGLITAADAGNQIANLRNDLNIKYKKSLEDEDKLRIEYNDRELEARNTISKNGNESDISVQEAITKNVQKELEARLDALKQSTADKAQIIADDYALQVKLAKEHGKTETEIAAITAEKDKALVELTANTQKDVYDIVVSYGDRKLKAIQEQNKAESSANAVTENYNQQTSALDAALVARTVSYEHYVNEKRKLDQKYAIEKDKADIKDDNAALQRVQDFENGKLKIELQAAQAKLDAAKITGDQDAVGKAQSEVDALLEVRRKFAAEDTAITAKRNKDQATLNKDEAAQDIAAAEFLNGKKKELAQQTYEFAKGLVEDAYEARINQIQETIDRENEQAQNQIAAIQRSTLSTRDQAAEVIILQAQQKARETELKNEQKQEKIKEAKFDRDLAVAEVLWKTAQAEMSAIAAYAGTPYAFAIAAVIAALGAVQVATILAKPIPAYAEGIGIAGKGEHPGGPAWVGEAFKPELVTMPGVKPFIVDRPTLIDLPVNSSVQPLDPASIVADLGGSVIMRDILAIGSAPDRNDGVVNAIDRQTAQLMKAYKRGQQRIVNIIKVPTQMIGLDAQYFNTKILGKK